MLNVIFQAQEICINYGQSWRAATLEGWRLYHDPNFESLTTHETIQPVEGNLYRDVWKQTCWDMCQEVCINNLFFLTSLNIQRDTEKFSAEPASQHLAK